MPRHAAHALAWLIALVALCNAIGFVWQVTSPVIRSDAWYFLDVFLRKAIEGHLTFADFFVKRPRTDHSQPLFKLVLWLEWRYFDLDFMIEALIGAFAAACCALIFHRLIFDAARPSRGWAVRCLAWATICGLLFSMNAEAGVWTWSLVTLEYLNIMGVLLFVMASWQAIHKRSYALLAMATVLIGICCDDLGLIAVIAVALALLLGRARDAAFRSIPVFRMLAVMSVCMVAVRLGYMYAPVVGTARPESLLSHLNLLPGRFAAGGWWKWIAWPLAFPVFHENAMPRLWTLAMPCVVTLLAVAHLWFWARALQGRLNRPVFVAICLMIFACGQVAGIVLGRVAVDGNDYLQQPRYMIRYAELLVALLLMWAGSQERGLPHSWLRRIPTGISALACVLLLAAQVPLSFHAWRTAPYQRAYQIQAARQIDELAMHPADDIECAPELTVCAWSVQRRRELTRLLSDNRLNVFSPRVQQRHTYLPALAPLPEEKKSPPPLLPKAT